MTKAYQKVMESREQVVNDLISLMEQGLYRNKDRWTSQNLAPHNPESKVNYRGGNRLRLMLDNMLRGRNDPRYCTFNQIKEAGFHLNKGSEGVLCEKWIFPKELLEKMPKIRRNKMSEEDIDEFLKKPPKVSFFYVYNMSQVKDYPEIDIDVTELTPDDMTNMADQLIATSECSVFEDKNGTKAYYRSSVDEVHIPSRNTFKSSEAFVNVLLHEMGHSTGHESRLNRNMKGKFGSEGYVREELTVELSTLFSCADLGIVPTLETWQDSSDYIKSWLKGKNASELFNVVKDSDRASMRIVNNYHDKSIEKDIEQEQKNRKKNRGAR